MPANKHLGYLAVKKETTWGTKDVSAMDFGYFMSEGVVSVPTPIVGTGINGTRFMNKRQPGQKITGGPFAFEVTPEDLIGTLLKQILPSETFVDDGVGNGGQHTFIGGDTLPPGFTLQVGRGRTDNVKDFEGGRLDSMGFALTPEGLLVCTVNATFQDESDGTDQAATYTTENEFKGADTTAVINVDGSSTDLRSFNMTITPGLVTNRRKLGSNLPQQQQPGVYDITGSFGIFYDDEVLINKVIDHTAFSTDIELKGTLIGTTTRAIKLTIPNAFFNGESPVVDGREGEILPELNWQAIKVAGSDLVSVKLTNSVRTAY